MQQDEQKIPISRAERNYGIDILKIVSIYMVIILHVLGQGGVLKACEVGSTHYYIAWFMESLSYCAVNCFAMATGYLMIDKKYKTARIIPLWLQVTFYSVLFTAIMHFLSYEVTPKFWFQSFLPVSTGLYWYFSAYVGLFFLMPFINKALNALSKKQFLILAIILTVFFSIIAVTKFSNVFATYAGYDCFWLCIMYIFGAGIKQHNLFNKINKKWCFIVFVIASGIAFLSYVYLVQHKDRPFKNTISDKFLLTYTSPMVVLAALALVMLCVKINLRNKHIKKIVSTLSSLSFGVYIIHLHKLFWNYSIKNAYKDFSQLEPLAMIGRILLEALIIFAVCSIIEWIRTKLFELLRINKLANLIGNKIDSLIKLGL